MYDGSAPPRLLLVETNEDESFLFQRMFTQVARHWHVTWEKDTASAIRHMIDQGLPDLFVTRIEMPERTGVDAVEWIRSLQTPKSVPVLIYDRVVSTDRRKELSSWGVEEYLDKHAAPEKFKIILRRITFEIEKEMLPKSETPTSGKRPSTPGFSRSIASKS
jgi:DNA-binding response OmpR family regulator